MTFDYRAACSRCGRYVSGKDIHVIAYRAAAGYYGEVDEGHSSHPGCGVNVPISVVARWVEPQALRLKTPESGVSQ